MQKIKYWNMYKYLQPEKIRRIEKSLLLAKNQADWEILAFAKNQADNRIFAGVEIPAPGEKPVFEEKPASEEKPAGLEKQAACLLFRLGGISSCWLLPGLADVSDVSFSLPYGKKSEDLQFADCSPKKFADLRLQFNKKKFADLKTFAHPTFANFPPLSTILAANLLPVSTTLVSYYPQYQQHRW